jgi:alcohol dehydrogenase (cytochrome c)
VSSLRVAWTLSLPPGPNEATPLVHEGVLFVHSYGDHIQALDAVTGDELWHYHRDIPRGAFVTVHRNIALYNDKVYFTTSDAHVIALESKTGKLVWEQSVADADRKVTFATGGPVVVKGVVMQGLNGSSSPGGAFVVGLNAATGKPVWRFNTIAQPGEPNGNSWNDLPLEKRTGGSVWTAGSYDPKSGLAYFGPAPTYDTVALRTRVPHTGITNDALYTDATIALDPQTGKLAWYFQHVQNDQWDLDWAFERQIVDLTVHGQARRLVITAGKEAVYDALDARTGRYEFSIDLGLQNLIIDIDPNTGAKAINRNLTPGGNNTVTACPDAGGGKSWQPASYDPKSKILYVPLTEACMDIRAARKGLLAGIRMRPRFESDGRYGRLQAINLNTRRTVWIERQRSPLTTGALATAGGVVFAGSLDRWFAAYDASNGASLWKIRLTDVPNAAPITFRVNNRQYVAVIVGGGFGLAGGFFPLAPEIRPPATESSAIWVFELSR